MEMYASTSFTNVGYGSSQVGFKIRFNYWMENAVYFYYYRNLR